MGYRQTVTPDRVQGRMNATIRSINRAMIVIGTPLGGVIGDAYWYRATLWIAAGRFLSSRSRWHAPASAPLGSATSTPTQREPPRQDNAERMPSGIEPPSYVELPSMACTARPVRRSARSST